MGYPMTWQRIVNRNRLTEADYGDKVSGFNTEGVRKLHGYSENDGTHLAEQMVTMACNEIDQANSRWSLLVGDIKRLGTDAVDEVAICNYIAGRTGFQTEVVAAVLKEFFQW